jgi:hypothetical protein
MDATSENARAVERAKAVLKPGDRLFITTCGNGRGATVTMTGWSETFPGFITSKTMHDDELHPVNVRRRNGQSVGFRDPPVLSPF